MCVRLDDVETGGGRGGRERSAESKAIDWSLSCARAKPLRLTSSWSYCFIMPDRFLWLWASFQSDSPCRTKKSVFRIGPACVEPGALDTRRTVTEAIRRSLVTPLAMTSRVVMGLPHLRSSSLNGTCAVPIMSSRVYVSWGVHV